jgi:ankyrin repeat protein
VNAIGSEYGTALQAACAADDIETVRVLLNAGADLSAEAPVSGFYGTALQAAASEESIEIVRELIEAGAAVNVYPANGTYGSALTAAATADEPDIAELLLEHGADVNFAGGYDHLPIMAAAQSGKLAILKLLLDHGADVSAQGGMWGSTITAAAYGNDLECFQLLLDHGADVRATGGHYGCALQAAAIKADMGIIDILLEQAPDFVNYRGGKYHTPLIGAAYYDRLEVVERLLNVGADIRHQGGQFRSAINAAAIKGNKAILERLLELRPDNSVVDEALVEACAHRQATTVEILLQSRANVFARHPTLGSATEALDAPELIDENSDDEEEDPDNESDESEDEDAESQAEKRWEGDDGAPVADDTDDDSVTDLKLEEDVTEKAKIQKLLEEAMILRKRNPTVERFKSVRRRGVPTGSGARPPPPPVPRLPPIAAGESYQPPTQKEIVTSPYGHHSQEPYSLPFRTNSGHEIPAAAQASAAIQSSTTSNPSYPPALFARKPVHSPSDSPHRTTSPQSLEHGQYHVQPSQAERQFSTGSVSTLPRSDTPPSRKGSADQGLKRQSKALHRKSIANMGPAMRYQQRQSQQSPQGSMDVLTESHDFATTAEAPPAAPAIATPPPAPYSPYPPQQQYHPPPPPALPPRQSQYFNVPPQPEHFHSQQFHQPQQSPYPGPPPSQYQPYASPPIQGQGYPQYGQPPHVTPQPVYQGNHHLSNTPPVGQSFAWEMPVTSQGQPHRPSEAQARTWGTGGYDGAGYGT